MIYDYINYDKYQAENERVGEQERERTVIFMGNSITEGWSLHSPAFMKKYGYLNRGISGQTTD